MTTKRQKTYGAGEVFRKKRRGTEYGNIFARWYLDGVEQVENTHTRDWPTARKLLNERNGAKAKGEAPTAATHRTTVADVLDARITWLEVQRKASLRSERAHVPVITTALRGALGSMRVADLTTDHLLKFVVERRRAGDAEATINRRLECLRAAIRATPGVAVPNFDAAMVDESHNVRQGFATRAQFDALVADLRTTTGTRRADHDLADLVEWAYWTGMRIGAASGLRWDAVDREAWVLRMPPVGRAKKTVRAIPLLAGHPLRVLIERRWTRRVERGRAVGRLEPLIFWRVYQGAPRPGLRPGDAVPVANFDKRWTSAALAAGLPVTTKPLRDRHGVVKTRKRDGAPIVRHRATLLVHDLRRTAVRNTMAATDNNRRAAMTLSGHATDAMLDRYNIGAEDELVGVMGALVAHHATLPTGPTASPLTLAGAITTTPSPTGATSSATHTRRAKGGAA